MKEYKTPEKDFYTHLDVEETDKELDEIIGYLVKLKLIEEETKNE